MCEESACLVPPLEQNQNGPSDSRPVSNGGAPHNGEALVGFHEDALSQAAMGKAQLLLAIVLGLGLSAECSEITILGYILPAAELHLCIDEHEKSWLVSTTILSLAFGSFVWGILGDYIGRRRVLISCLSVAALFSAVATVMPTYGTFMTARVCSGLGIAGAFPLSFSYLSETCSRATRGRYIGILHSFWPIGALITSLIAHLTMPTLGSEIVEDNREHWSSWHRFLILSILPMIACIIGLIWASESPRYLLEASREVEALAVYQRLHRLNQARTQYGLTELELPGRNAYRERPTSPSRTIFVYGLERFREAFQSISSPTHFKTTSLLATLHLLLGFTYMGISIFSMSKIKQIHDEEYFTQRKYLSQKNYTGISFNDTLDNIQFIDTHFKNVSFKHVTLNHVEFTNCLIEETEFINVKSSITFFENATIKDCRFIDTDLTEHHFIDCNLINNTFMSLISDCIVYFDFNIYLEEFYENTLAWACFMFPVLLVIGFLLETVSRPPIVFTMLGVASFTSIGIFFWTNTFVVTLIELTIKALIMCAVNAINMVVIEGYPCHLRCTAHGVMRSLFHLASFCAIPIYSLFTHTMLLFPAVITISLTFFGAVLGIKIQDNSKALL